MSERHRLSLDTNCLESVPDLSRRFHHSTGFLIRERSWAALTVCSAAGKAEAGADSSHRGLIQEDGSAVKFCQLPDDGQAKARSRRCLVGAYAALQHQIALGRIDAGAVIIHTDFHGGARSIFG